MLKQVTVGATILVLSLGVADAQQAGQPGIPVPSASLLEQQPEPACEYRPPEQSATRALDNSKGGDPAADATALRTKLDYERQCFRHAEMIVRQRLHALQASVRVTVSAIQRSAKRTKETQAQQKVRSRAGRAAKAPSSATTGANYEALRDDLIK